MFALDVFAMREHRGGLPDTTTRNTNVNPVFTLDNLDASVTYQLEIYSYNDKGKSEIVTLQKDAVHVRHTIQKGKGKGRTSTLTPYKDRKREGG